MKNLLVALAVMLSGYSTLAQSTNKILSNYIAVKNALVSGDSKEASKAISTLQQSIKEESSLPEKDALLKATENMLKASGIEKQRAAFNNVSITMWKVVKGSNKVSEPVYYQYCPMKKAYWITNEKEIKNPYYGSSMLTCGNVVETKQ